MRLGIVSDIHCNVAGLRHALGLMGEIDGLICLGDSIYEYRFSNEVVRLLKDREAEADVVLYGHTHQQVVRRIGPVLVINPGSAGEARDSRNGGQLSCAVLDTAGEEMQLFDFPDPRAACP